MTLLESVTFTCYKSVVINFNDIIGAQFSTSSECNWCTKEKIDSDVRCTKFEHSILAYNAMSQSTYHYIGYLNSTRWAPRIYTVENNIVLLHAVKY